MRVPLESYGYDHSYPIKQSVTVVNQTEPEKPVIFLCFVGIRRLPKFLP